MNRNNKSVGTPWKDGTSLIKKMIERYARKLAREEEVERLTVFIDTNPAFSVPLSISSYTNVPPKLSLYPTTRKA